MKIFHVTNGIEWSGGMEQISLLIAEIKKKSHENHLACPPGSKLIERLAPLKIDITQISMRQDYDLIAAWKIRGLVQSLRPDIVHTHHAIAHAVTLVALTGLKRPPLVVSRRVSFSPRKNPFSRWKYGSSRIDAYSVVSRSVKETLVQGGVRPEKIHVIYSALDPKRFENLPPISQIKKSLQVPEGVKIIGKLANYSLWKGQYVFLQAASICLEKRKDLIFLLIGKDTENLKGEVEKLEVANSVKILGFRADAPQILSILDVSINSAIEGEGLSGAMRESLALGIPVIATGVAGNREIVRDGETGWIVPPSDPQGLAKKILEVLENPVPGKEMAQRGRKWVLENATAEKMTSDLLGLYQSLLQRTPNPRLFRLTCLAGRRVGGQVGGQAEPRTPI